MGIFEVIKLIVENAVLLETATGMDTCQLPLPYPKNFKVICFTNHNIISYTFYVQREGGILLGSRKKPGRGE
jgi:hypothetical protein